MNKNKKSKMGGTQTRRKRSRPFSVSSSFKVRKLPRAAPSRAAPSRAVPSRAALSRATPSKKIPINTENTENNKCVFLSNEGESNLEANMSVLIELMGSSMYDEYIDLLNDDLDDNHKLEAINIKDNPKLYNLNNGPKIFYGDKKGTHFTCTLGDNNSWNPYKNVQKINTDHFCQTFCLIYMEHNLKPDSFIGQKYIKLHKDNNNINIDRNFINNLTIKINGKNLHKNQKQSIIDEYYYIKNVLIAIKVACYVLKEIYKEKDNDFINNTHVNDIIYDGRHKINKSLSINNDTTLIVEKLINYCENINEKDILNSSFIQKIFNLS